MADRQHDGTRPVPFIPQISRAQAARAVDGDLAVVVVELVSNDPEHFRRRVLLNLPSAERAARRARETGKPVEIVLVRLDPVAVVALDTDQDAASEHGRACSGA